MLQRVPDPGSAAWLPPANAGRGQSLPAQQQGEDVTPAAIIILVAIAQTLARDRRQQRCWQLRAGVLLAWGWACSLLEIIVKDQNRCARILKVLAG